MLRLKSLFFNKYQIPYAMAQFQATVFKLGQRAVGWLWCVAFGTVLQLRLGTQDFQHLHGVVFPVGGAMQVTAWRQAIGQLLDEWRLDQTALVMACLVPGIGEEYVDAGQRIGRDHMCQHFHRIVLQQAQIRQRLFVDQFQQATYARRMHFHADKILFRHGLGNMRGRRTHAKTDFQYDRRLAAEYLFKILRLLGKWQQKLRMRCSVGSYIIGRAGPFAGVSEDMGIRKNVQSKKKAWMAQWSRSVHYSSPACARAPMPAGQGSPFPTFVQHLYACDKPQLPIATPKKFTQVNKWSYKNSNIKLALLTKEITSPVYTTSGCTTSPIKRKYDGLCVWFQHFQPSSLFQSRACRQPGIHADAAGIRCTCR